MLEVEQRTAWPEAAHNHQHGTTEAPACGPMRCRLHNTCNTTHMGRSAFFCGTINLAALVQLQPQLAPADTAARGCCRSQRLPVLKRHRKTPQSSTSSCSCSYAAGAC
jgi:hypothetical protein